MAWIAEAINNHKNGILKHASGQLSAQADAQAFGLHEIENQAESTLELLLDSLSDVESEELTAHWRALGEECASRGLNISMIPNTPEILKRAIWSQMEREVELGNIKLSDLVDAMMEVESVLSGCWYEMSRAYLGSRDIKVTRKTARQDALYSLSEVLSGETDKYQMYQKIAEKVSSITELGRCSLLVFGNKGDLEPVASNKPELLEALKGSQPEEIAALAAIVSLGGPVVLTRGNDNTPELQELLERYGSPSVLLVPLKSAEKDIGLMLLDEGSDGEFDQEQIDMAVASANQAAVAVEKSELIAEMENRLKHMAAMGIVARNLTSYLDPQEQYSSLQEMACALVRADGGVILLADDQPSDIEVVASYGKPAWKKVESLYGLARSVVESGELTVYRKGTSDSRFADIEDAVQAGIIAPLKFREKAVGVIVVTSTEPGERYSREDLELFGNFAAQAAISIENTQLYDRLQDTYLGAIASLAMAIEARDPYTVGHSRRVTQYAVAIAESMGLPKDEIEDLRLAGLLHDIGKIGVPDSILNKPDRLSEEEFSVIKMHPELSMRILEPLPHLGKIIPIIYNHHERYDGRGYIDGKSGEDIPQGARIIAVADAFEAMTSDRPYRRALTREEAISEIKKNAGSQFDPEVVEHFLGLLQDTAPAE